jgi:hypothetical protein
MLDKPKQVGGWSEEGAERLSEQIYEYWKAKGYDISVRIEPVPGKFGQYQVRSDLINGAPGAKS